VALILDTGPLIASFDRDEVAHGACRDLIRQTDELRVVPAPVLPEIDYLVRRRFGAGPVVAFFRDIESGSYVVEDLVAEDYPRVRDLMDRYADLGVGFVDAAVLAIVERFGETKLATLDRRHFSVMRPRHVEALELLPA
jgi:hypothetical protein